MTTGTSPNTASKQHERTSSMEKHDTVPLAHQLELVTLERDMLRQEREREAGLIRALEQALQRVEHVEQQLHDARQHIQAQQAAKQPRRVIRTGPSMRPGILALLRQHPDGLTRLRMEEELPGKSLRNVLGHMCRDGLLTLNDGLYFVTPDADAKMQARARRRTMTP